MYCPLIKSDTRQISALKVTLLSLMLVVLIACGGSNGGDKPSSSTKPVIEPPAVTSLHIIVDAPESGSAVYLDGKYTGLITPAELELDAGEHRLAIGLKDSRQYLSRTVELSDDSDGTSIYLDNSDLQSAKIWQALFIGVNQVQGQAGDCISEYSRAELDVAYEFFQWSFAQQVEDYSYHTMDWHFDRRDINNEVVTLGEGNLISPDVLEPYISDINKGDYDLIVTFFNGGAGDEQANGCYIDDFKGIAWFDYRVLQAEASYYTIRYFHDAIAAISSARQDGNDPGMFIHEWLHTTAEWFFPDLGYQMPSQDGQVVHAAGAYNYQFPWMSWYRDLISGQVKQGSDYIGIGPEALLACTVREYALLACGQ